MSKKQRDSDVEFIRTFAGSKGRTWQAALLAVADALAEAPLDGRKPAPEPEMDPMAGETD